MDVQPDTRSVAADELAAYTKRLNVIDAAMPVHMAPMAISRAIMIIVVDYIDQHAGTKAADVFYRVAASLKREIRADPPPHIRFEVALATRVSVVAALGQLVSYGLLIRQDGGNYHTATELWLKLREADNAQEGHNEHVEAGAGDDGELPDGGSLR